MSNNIIKNFIKILENPDAKKGYVDVIDFYKKNKMHKEANYIEYLLEKKFNANDSNISKK